MPRRAHRRDDPRAGRAQQHGGTYVLTGELAITAPVTITGTANHPTIASNGSSRVFAIDSDVAASISGLEIANGKDSIGGGILNSGELTLTNDVIDDNTTVDGVPQGGIGTAGGSGGGLYNRGTATLTSVQVMNNRTGKGGAARGAVSALPAKVARAQASTTPSAHGSPSPTRR